MYLDIQNAEVRKMNEILTQIFDISVSVGNSKINESNK